MFRCTINIEYCTCIAAFLVFFMQAGFALVETGFTRAKNACNILIIGLRVSEREEFERLDLAEHGIRAYRRRSLRKAWRAPQAEQTPAPLSEVS